MKNILFLLLLSVLPAMANSAVTIDGNGNIVNSPNPGPSGTITLPSAWAWNIAGANLLLGGNPPNTAGGVATAPSAYVMFNFNNGVSPTAQHGYIAVSYDGLNFKPLPGLDNYVPPNSTVSGLPNGVRDPGGVVQYNGLYYLIYGATDGTNYFTQVATATSLSGTWTYLEQNTTIGVAPSWFYDPISGNEYVISFGSLTGNSYVTANITPNTGNDGHTFGTTVAMHGFTPIINGYLDPRMVVDNGYYKCMVKNAGVGAPYHLWTLPTSSGLTTGTFTDQGQMSSTGNLGSGGEGMAFCKDPTGAWLLQTNFAAVWSAQRSTATVLETDAQGANWSSNITVNTNVGAANNFWDNGTLMTVANSQMITDTLNGALQNTYAEPLTITNALNYNILTLNGVNVGGTETPLLSVIDTDTTHAYGNFFQFLNPTSEYPYYSFGWFGRDLTYANDSAAIIFTANSQNSTTNNFEFAVGQSYWTFAGNGQMTLATNNGNAQVPLVFQANGSYNGWSVGMDLSANGTKDFFFFNNQTNKNDLRINPSNDNVEIPTGNVAFTVVGKTVSLKGGSNACSGTITLASGTGTVTSTAITASSVIFTSLKTAGGTETFPPLVTVSTGTAVFSANALDTGTYNWVMLLGNQ